MVATQTFFIFIPGEMIQFDEHIFQMGWFNHQPAHDDLLVGLLPELPGVPYPQEACTALDEVDNCGMDNSVFGGSVGMVEIPSSSLVIFTHLLVLLSANQNKSHPWYVFRVNFKMSPRSMVVSGSRKRW